MYYTITLKVEGSQRLDSSFELSTSNYHTAKRTFWDAIRTLENNLEDFELTWLKNNHHSQEPLVLMHLTNITIPKPPNNYKYKNEQRELEFCNSCMNNLNELCDPVPIEGSPMPFNQD